MENEWTGTGIWEGWRITTDHAASSHGQPVLVSPTGLAYGPGDIQPSLYTQSDLAKALGITRGAIADRLRRGTLPPFDEGKMWRYETIKPLLP